MRAFLFQEAGRLETGAATRFADLSLTLRRGFHDRFLYQTDSYLREFDATVVAVDAEAGRVALDRTAFYPGGGGQPGDVGDISADL